MCAIIELLLYTVQEEVETFGIDWDELLNTIDDDSTVLVPETECPINYDHLYQSIDPQASSDSYGIDIFFFKTVELINNQLSIQ